MAILDQYNASKIRHPSWRVYKAIDDIRERFPEKKDVLEEITPKAFGLNEHIEVYYPYTINDDITEELIRALTTNNYEDDIYSIVDPLSLFCSISGRQVIECMLMTGTSPMDVANDLGYSGSMVQTYAQLFYDVSVWRTFADRDNYLSKGVCGEDASTKNTVADKGIEYAKIRIFRMPSKIKLEKALVNLFAKSYEKSLQALNSSSPEDDENAQYWIKTTLLTFRELKNATQAEGGIRELTIALQASPAPRVSVDDLNAQNDSI